MTISVLFWMLFILTLLFGGWGWTMPTAPPFTRWGSSFMILILIAILGWKVFGAAIHG